MKRVLPVLLPPLMLIGCNAPDNRISPSDHPFTGCWQNEDGSSREVWVQDPSGWLFGYSANREQDGRVSFYEQMRLEPRDDELVFIVIGPKNNVTEFTRVDTGAANEFQFINTEHDYPQVISYKTTPGRLDAYISLSNGEERIEFPKRACD